MTREYVCTQYINLVARAMVTRQHQQRATQIDPDLGLLVHRNHYGLCSPIALLLFALKFALWGTQTWICWSIQNTTDCARQ